MLKKIIGMEIKRVVERDVMFKFKEEYDQKLTSINT